MSSPNEADEDEMEEEVELEEEVEFVSLEDKITQHKAHVVSTLDRLAHQVAQEKKERAAKCRAFKEKQILQKAHGQQELAVTSTNGINQEAKRCVDMWLKMPGLKPGVISAGSGRRHTLASFPRGSSTRHTCPVINCGRIYDNVSLLDGHLKRFDHSPCDPAINLRGSQPDLFACVACSHHYPTKEAWRRHVESKVSSPSPDGHSMNQTYQRIVCFACPACYLLFNLRDECLQHMSAKNHFTESLAMNDNRGAALPVPVPQLVKNRLITLCKEVAFTIQCSLCHKVLISHQAAQAHFNVLCRHGCAVAKADKTIVDVMKRLQVRGQCPLCSQIFFSQAEIERHKESMQHDVEVNQTIAKALVQYSSFSEIQYTQRAMEAQEKRQSTGLEISFQRRNKRSDCDGSPAKRQRLSQTMNASSSRTLAWFCECGLQFSEESTASKHLLAANQIFHQCGVCGKHMGESSIARLHMSRFHGGAHLSNFLFYCRKCKLEMPRYEDILSHVSDSHSGHTYFAEQEVPEGLATVLDAKPSTSNEVTLLSVSKVQQNMMETCSSTVEYTWMCRMCEDVFNSEAAVQKHCSDMSSHSFQRFICGHCPQKFFKESTVRRHCTNEHGGQIKSFHFCGLCDSMQFESEEEFMEHYKSLHSKDYYCMDDTEVVQPTAAEGIHQLTCPCMGSEKSKEEMKATYTRCMKNLAAEGKCQYMCAPCSISVASYAQMKTHIHTKHGALNLDKTFDVECKACQESFKGVPSFHKHYHSQHCTLEPCMSSRTCRKDSKAEPTAVKIINAVEIKPDNDDEADDEIKRVLSLSAEEARESAELEEALKRSLLEF
ncbi:E3 SUMO-protein ligase ZNF451 isoform X2 [Melanotaenia boesemani]|uniref:E3 SUMO-protein ligase ZNF451 isoform X2 n=1 Tax=Melanotaenia boesemani TaxID=1250792 RepID=UPI001C03BAD5|nr:E3 SUMO-protein ligase ZNF451 isoform X2 [Melanotaenia boesemani]